MSSSAARRQRRAQDGDRKPSKPGDVAVLLATFTEAQRAALEAHKALAEQVNSQAALIDALRQEIAARDDLIQAMKQQIDTFNDQLQAEKDLVLDISDRMLALEGQPPQATAKKRSKPMLTVVADEGADNTPAA